MSKRERYSVGEMTLGKLFGLYINIFDEFGLHLLNETDQMIEYYVFEETDVNIGFCSSRILNKFLEEGIINEDIFENSSLLLEKFRKLEGTMQIRNAESIRNSFEWKEMMELSDCIREMIKTKWTAEELSAILNSEQLIDLSF